MSARGATWQEEATVRHRNHFYQRLELRSEREDFYPRDGAEFPAYQPAKPTMVERSVHLLTHLTCTAVQIAVPTRHSNVICCKLDTNEDSVSTT